MPVYLSDGRILGRLEEVGHGADYLHVQQGNILVRDWYVPIGAVEDVSPQGGRLGTTLADLRRNGWNVPPEEYLSHQGATPGYEYQSSVVSRQSSVSGR